MSHINKLGSTRRKIYFFVVRKKLLIKNLFYKNIDNKHLFILSPPFCGSTLLNEIITSSNNISCNNNIGLREGQHLPEIKDLLFTNDKWNPNKKINWKLIHEIWNKYWDKSKAVFLEKSPPNICRALDIEKEFKHAHFICLVRDPYAQAEGIIRRNNATAEYAANFVLKGLEYQKKNIERLNNVILISYEELSRNHEETKRKIISFLPVLHDINTTMNFSAHNIRGMKSMAITDLNQEKIDKIEKNDMEIINTIFRQKRELLKSFNYKILK